MIITRGKSINYHKMVGSKIKQLRKEHGLTQKELSKILRVSLSLLAMAETDKRKLPQRAIKNLKSLTFFNYPSKAFDAFVAHEENTIQTTAAVKVYELEKIIRKKKYELKLIKKKYQLALSKYSRVMIEKEMPNNKADHEAERNLEHELTKYHLLDQMAIHTMIKKLSYELKMNKEIAESFSLTKYLED